MNIVRYLRDAALALNDPHLVAKFQKLCKIDISYSDSGFSTACSESRDSSSSENNFDNDNVDDADGNSSSPNNNVNAETLKKYKTVNNHTNNVGDPISFSNGSIPRKRKPNPGNVEPFRKFASSSAENYLFEHSMENHVSFKIRNRFLYYLFSLGSALGNETFYCFFFSYWIWNIDGFVCRRLVLIWSMLMYIGQAIKDIVCWPRPESPPVAKLEKRYELEYGMPSTHAMVGFAIPFSMLVLTAERYIYSWPLMVVVCISWCSAVCLSRCYLGMHSFLDVGCGLLLSIILTPILIHFVGVIDRFQLTNPYSPIVMIAVPLFFAFCYPTLEKWSTARGDTVLILGVMSGIAVASRMAYSQGLYSEPLTPPPYSVKLPDTEFVLTTVVRMALGGTILIGTRAGMKAILLRLLCAIFGEQHDDPKSRQMLKIELPYKFFTYLVLAINVVYAAPLMFKYIGVSRVTNFTDL